jgi:signal transduction histidine kinase
MLEERNDALEFANRVKNDFVHNVSWELRSPLQTVTGFVQMLADGTAGPLNDKQRDYAEHISRSSQALLALMNDIFDLASIDTGTLELDMAMVEPRVVVGAAVAGLAGRVSEAGIHLDVNVPMNLGPFRADPLRVRQVLFNLISNAIGFSEPGQTITVSAWRERDDMVFKVSDQGRGIPVEMQGKIFERFESQPGGTRHKGVGLGLSIVQAFVALHGGQVKLESEPGRGTSFLCIFPARSVAMADMAGDARDVTPGRARQVNE